MKLLVELIFRGDFESVNLFFLNKFLLDAKDVYLNSPEIILSSEISLEDIVDILQTNNYVDLVITTDNLDINGKYVQNVFINIGRNSENIEILIFFDLHDLNILMSNKGINYLKNWMQKFTLEYKFQYFICQSDNADENEYYFDSNGFGNLYNGELN